MSSDPTTRHSLLEDAQAFVLSTSIVAFSVIMLTHMGLITGQTAGLAVLIAYATGFEFGPIFFLINLRFLCAGVVTHGAAIHNQEFHCRGVAVVIV